MAVTLHIPRILARFSAGSREFELEATSFSELLSLLFELHPELRERLVDRGGQLYPYFALFKNSHGVERSDLTECALESGDELDLVAAVVGGNAARYHDVRMRGFRERVSVARAADLAWGHASPLPAEQVPVTEAYGRVLASEVTSAVSVPGFRRSAMDGYALRAEDSFGASLYDPLELAVVGEALPGAAFGRPLNTQEALRIMTGAPVPEGADAVLKAEDAREQDGRLFVSAALPPGKNVGRIGEDIEPGQRLLASGRRLRPQDIGVLVSVGLGQAVVHRRPRVRVISSGNELLAPGQRPEGARIVDSNGPMLAALIARDGGVLESLRRVPDDERSLRAALSEPGVDVIVASGGSSVGCEDFLPVLVAELGELLVHGVAMRPSAPTGFGSVGAARVFLLPGNPVSCLCAYDFFAGPLLRVLGGRSGDWCYPTATLPLKRGLSSQIGRVDYARVRVIEGAVEPLAISGASILSSTTRADGFVILEEGSEGFPAGSPVLVHFYDQEPPRRRFGAV